MDDYVSVVPGDSSMLNGCIKKDAIKRMFVCQICGKESSQKSNIKKHVEGVDFPGQFVYKCEICDKDFNGKNSLSVHLYKFHGTSASDK